ncbi:tripartite tricarboxylate transporter substrate-binding protein [Bordetella petrii]|uniref:tripartite tricarboxylate transporter substrate-binding protein n=1 Tax=Bordetella petrii TaxID=94624 RepID=UPI001E3479B7|nr:tripartite tricarboxylate transporter substrate-binding protein [Bordetella petrii]MCD0505100.1 tripartite tricarboxylate transporter substrate binding protein BugD [Bordetella petrii]
MIRFHCYAAPLAALLLLVCAVPSALAQPFPQRPVTLVVPFPAGGPSDALARGFAQHMGERLGQPMVVENVGGAGGTIGLQRVARAQADGYTLGFGTLGTHVANAAVYPNLPYDPQANFLPIGLAGSAPMLLLARPDFPADTLPQFADWLATRGDKATYGSAGVGSISHYGCVLLLAALNRPATHVPYRGVAPAISDLMGGQTDFMCDQTTTSLPQIAGGKLKAIAVLSDTPLAQLPGVGTAAQAGYPLNIRSWNALFAPRGTPEPALARLQQALQDAASDAKFAAQMKAVGVDLPQGDAAGPQVVTDMIQRGLRDDVPALKARQEFLN